MKSLLPLAVAGMMAVMLMGCASPKPVAPFGTFWVNPGENGTNAIAKIVLMDDGTLRWKLKGDK